MSTIVISGTGMYAPPDIITNEQLVDSYNQWTDLYNAEHAEEIADGTLEAAPRSTAEFIEKASGIKRRHSMFTEGLLDPKRMMPLIPKRSDDELSEMAEMGVYAARDALEAAGKSAGDVDLVINAASTMQRPWPAIGVEIQDALGCGGYAFDMSVACSSATFAASTAMDALLAGSATVALIVNPELTVPQMNFRSRDSHFIFGDVATAMVLERTETATSDRQFRINGRSLQTRFSNNIRSNFGYISRCLDQPEEERFYGPDQFFVQEGRRVFKELVPMVCTHVEEHLARDGVPIGDIRRMWLHQANINMNNFAARKILGREPEPGEAPIVLDEYANTASAGSIIAFHENHKDFAAGDKGLICSFGAGYSIGSLIVEQL